MSGKYDYILSDPIQITKYHWIRHEIGPLGKQWSVYHCTNGFEANHMTFVTAPEEKEDAIRICKMFEPKKEKERNWDDDLLLLLGLLGVFAAMMVVPVIMLA